jgi:pyruvate formate lyase activating enzyme
MKSESTLKSAARRSQRLEAFRLSVGGFEPFSTVDFPGALAAVIFCQGCPLRCGYCHNPDLIAAGEGGLSFERILGLLGARKSLLDGVVFSGGEPLAQGALSSAASMVRSMGFKIGLHTAGTSPAALERTLPVVDWVGFDVKAPFESYGRVAGVDAGSKARRALELLVASGAAFEVRTTVWPDRLGADEIREIAFALRQLGVQRYVLQEARTPDRKPWPGGSMIYDRTFVAGIGALFREFEVRFA